MIREVAVAVTAFAAAAGATEAYISSARRVQLQDLRTELAELRVECAGLVKGLREVASRVPGTIDAVRSTRLETPRPAGEQPVPDSMSPHGTRPSFPMDQTEVSPPPWLGSCGLSPIGVVLHEDVRAFGTHGRECTLEDRTLTMRITDRDGDFGMCCVDLKGPLDLTSRSTICGELEAEKREPKVDAKLEVIDSAKHIFFAHETPVSGRMTFSHRLTEVEKKWRSNRICIAAIGDGPTPNTIRLHEVGFVK